MIVSGPPKIGHAFQEIYWPLVVLFVWDVVVTFFHFKVWPIPALELPLGLYGTALALFLSIRDNAAYARCWEARGLWGLMINASRNIAREALTLCQTDQPKARTELVREIVYHQIAFVHVLRTALRGEALPPEATTYLPEALRKRLEGTANRANLILTRIGELAGEAATRQMLDPYARVQMERVLVDIANAQGGMERIRNTPLPSQYRFFPALFTRIFCVLLPFAMLRELGIYTPAGSTFVGLMMLILLQIGDDLKDPFCNDVHDVPMTGMCNTIEIDLLQMIGEPAPPKVQPVNGVLW